MEDPSRGCAFRVILQTLKAGREATRVDLQAFRFVSEIGFDSAQSKNDIQGVVKQLFSIAETGEFSFTFSGVLNRTACATSNSSLRLATSCT